MSEEKKSEDCIQVVVRARPLNKREKENGSKHIVDIDGEARTIQINDSANSGNSKSYTFDGVYDEKTQQKFFYEDCCFSLIENVLEGFNATVFAYGQTGCGKSFTMQGPDISTPEMRGVIPNSFAHIFDAVKASSEVEFLVRCSYLELYNEEIKDLLADPKVKKPPKCDVKEDPNKGVYVKNLTDVMVKNEEELEQTLNRGLALRTVAETQMNAESSRSHSIFTIIVEMSEKDADTGKDKIKVGKLNLVDLAGSERQKKTGASGAVLKEGAKINLSLSALGNVISALSEAKKNGHIPYRDSKLTRLLQDSLGGNTKTLMVAAISPADYNYDETLSTLRYANRAKNIQNKPKINEDPKDTMMRELKEQVAALKKMLEEQAKGGGTMIPQMGGATPDNSTPQVAPVGMDPSAFEAEKAAMQEALAEERRKAEEMAAKMAAMESMMVGASASKTQTLATPGSPAQVVAAEQTEEEIEAAKRLKERRKKAKAKKEAKRQKEIERIRLEKEAMEEEMEDLRHSAQGALGQAHQDSEERASELYKKLVKLKRKYEKKLQAARQETDEIVEEATYQRQQLLDSLREQEKDTRLYEAVCLSLVSERELKKIVDKARYEEEEEYWIIPYQRRKSYDNEAPSGGGGNQFGMDMNGMNGMHDGGGMAPVGMGHFNPAVQQPIPALGMLGGGGNGSHRRGSKDSLPSLGADARSANSGGMDEYGEITFQGGAAGFAGSSMESMPFDPSAISSSSMIQQDMSSCGVLPGHMSAGGSMLPNLKNSKGGGGGGGGGSAGGDPYDYDMNGGGMKAKSKKDMTPEEREQRALKKAAKAKKKAEKLKKQQDKAMALGEAHVSDEAGTGVAAGSMEDWGWGDDGKLAGEEEPTYSDDEDFDAGQGEGSKVPSMPRMEKSSKYSSRPKGGGSLLPSI